MEVIEFMGGLLVLSEKVKGMKKKVLREKEEEIVVLKGGKQRVKEGIKILKEKRGKRIIIRGVNK